MTRDQLKQLETDLWSAADNLRANSDLKSSEYSTPVLGLIFLKFADNNYRRQRSQNYCRISKAQRHAIGYSANQISGVCSVLSLLSHVVCEHCRMHQHAE
jgi:type I restriction-modification system DNA methylase subunit